MNDIYYQSDDTITFPVVEGLSIHDVNEDVFYTLESEVAINIWNMVNGSNTMQDIINSLSNEYDIDQNILKDDVISFISNLLENYLIKKK